MKMFGYAFPITDMVKMSMRKKHIRHTDILLLAASNEPFVKLQGCIDKNALPAFLVHKKICHGPERSAFERNEFGHTSMMFIKRKP
jgi:hypothetical protein